MKRQHSKTGDIGEDYTKLNVAAAQQLAAEQERLRDEINVTITQISPCD